MRYLFLIVFCFASLLATAQDIKAALQSFIFDGHEILDYAEGDINADGRKDVVLILKARDEAERSDVIEHPTPRPLFLLTREADNSLRLAAYNDQTVLCYDCGGMFGDPYHGITIKGNYFSIEHYGGSAWRWTRIVTFKYNPQQNAWFLHKDGGEHFHSADPNETMTEKVRTVKDFGVVRFWDFSVY